MELLVGIGVPLIGFIIWLAKRHLENKDDKRTITEKYEKELAQTIAKGDARDLNAMLNERLSNIRSARRGQGSSSSGKE